MASKTVVEHYKLYNGEVDLEYLPNSHTYKVDGDKKIGVTTITGVINKEALRLYPLTEAITYLTRELVEKPKKMSAKLITSSIEAIEKLLAEAKGAFRSKNLRGTDVGTFGHAWLEQYMISLRDGTDMPEKMERIDMAQFGKKPDAWEDSYIRATDQNHLCDAIEQFINWVAANDVEIMSVERIVYSREYDYCGRLDVILKINGKVYIVDFKTSNPAREFPLGIYPENFAQLGGYDIAITEEDPSFKIDGHAVFNLSKKTGELNIDYSEDREMNRDFFIYALGTKRGMQHHTRRLSGKNQDKESKK